MKAKLFTTLFAVAILLGVLKFCANNNSEGEKSKAYKVLSNSLIKWRNSNIRDSTCSILNLDDTLLFNNMAENKNGKEVKYFRFNDEHDLGNFYRFVLTCKCNDLVNGYNNLYNPPETEFMIRESFPILRHNTDISSGQIGLYSRTGDGEQLKVIYTNNNDYESTYPDWTGDTARLDPSVTSAGNFSEKLDSTCLYSSTFHEGINNISKGKEIAIVITADVFLVGNSSPLLVYDEKKGDRSIRWNSLDVRKFAGNSERWEKVFFMLKTGKNPSSSQSIVIYFWNHDKGKFFIDNFKVEGYLLDK